MISKRVVGLVVAGGLCSFGFCLLVQRLEDGHFRSEFARESASLAMDLQRAKEAHLMQLDNLAGFYRASAVVDPDEFEIFVGTILTKHPSLKALEWIPRVSDARREEFETTSWDGVSAPLVIKERRDGELVPARVRPEYFPVYYVMPREPNMKALGFDLASEGARREVLRLAAETGEQAATCPIMLVQSQSDGFGFVVVNPIYREGYTPPGAAPNRDDLLGYVAGVFLFSELADEAFMDQLPERVSMTVSDTSNPEKPIEIAALGISETPQDSMSRQHEIQFAGRKWTLRFVPDRTQVIAARSPASGLILAGGLLATLILGILFGKIVRHAARSREAEDRTRETLDALEAAFEEASLLGKITERINAGHGISEILEFVYTTFANIIPYDRIGLALVEADGKTVCSQWARSKHGVARLGEGYRAPLEGSSLKDVFESGMPRIIDDLPSYAVAHPDSTSSQVIVDEGMRSSLTCPLIAKGEAVGFLFFSSRKPCTYKSTHTEKFMRVASQLSVIVEKGQLFDAVAEEEKRSEEILQSLLPPEILVRVRKGEKVIADEVPAASVVFADFVDFSVWASRLDSSELVTLLDRIFKCFDDLADKTGLVKIGSQGDSYLAVAGAVTPRRDHARLAAEFALALQRETSKFLGPKQCQLSLRIGIHSGPLVAGVIGRFAWRYDIWGQTVNLASRMESQGKPGKIQISMETAAQLRQGYRLTKRSPILTKGFGRIQTYWLDGRLRHSPLAPPIREIHRT